MAEADDTLRQAIIPQPIIPPTQTDEKRGPVNPLKSLPPVPEYNASAAMRQRREVGQEQEQQQQQQQQEASSQEEELNAAHLEVEHHHESMTNGAEAARHRRGKHGDSGRGGAGAGTRAASRCTGWRDKMHTRMHMLENQVESRARNGQEEDLKAKLAQIQQLRLELEAFSSDTSSDSNDSEGYSTSSASESVASHDREHMRHFLTRDDNAHKSPQGALGLLCACAPSVTTDAVAVFI